MAVTAATNDTFQKEVLDNKNLVLVDFYADWCGPCKMTAPIIDQLSEEEKYKDNVSFVKINVDENQELAGNYNVFSIPTFILFKQGKPVHQFVGARDKSGFEQEIQAAQDK